jgi:hypothetical protein
MVRIMHTLVTDELICVLGPLNAASFTKGGDAAGNFKIVNGRELRAAKAVPSGAYSLTVSAVNSQGEASTTPLGVTVFVDPKAPTDIALSAATVAASAAIDTVVGDLTTTDPEVGDTFTYRIDQGTGDFKIGGTGNAQLLVARSLAGKAGTNIPVRIITTDAAGLTFIKIFSISIT